MGRYEDVALKLIPQELLDKLEYRDGELYWLESRGKVKSGGLAGYITPHGRKAVFFNKVLYYSHRIIYTMTHGCCPDILDHINGDRLDNRVENLRPATTTQNHQNRRAHTKNNTGHKNIYFRRDKYEVAFNVNGKRMNFGTYFDIDYAIFVATAMRHKYHGKFARHK
jgi:hypothetical protein